MYNKKSAGPRMEPWGTPALLAGYSCEDFPPQPPAVVYYWEKKN